MKVWFGTGALVAGALGLFACQTPVGDAGCEVGSTIVLPLTPFTRLANLRVETVASGYVLMGSDATTLRWATLGRDGTLGTERSLPLPAGAINVAYALSRTSEPWDSVLIAATLPAPDGTDAELRFLHVPADGSVATAQPGPAVLRFYPSATSQPPALASARNGGPAGLGWVDPTTGAVTYARVDGTGQVVVGPTPIETAAAFSCLRFTGGTSNLTLSYQRQTSSSEAASFVKAELMEDGTFATLLLSVSQSKSMGCAIGVPMDPPSAGYALAWQDRSGSWLSVYTAPPANRVISYPFASATDFGGPDLQPPIVGLTAYGADFGVMFSLPHSVELWRLDPQGNRRSGALLFPSLKGNIGEVSSANPAQGGLIATYSDYSSGSASGDGRRLVVDATCH